MRSDGMATFAECALTAQPALWRRLRDSIGACSCAGGGSAYESASESASERARPPVRACSLANVQHPSPVPVKLWQGRAKSRCRCGRGEPSPGAGVARQCACLPESTSHVANVDGSPMYGFRAPRVPARCPASADRIRCEAQLCRRHRQAHRDSYRAAAPRPPCDAQRKQSRYRCRQRCAQSRCKCGRHESSEISTKQLVPQTVGALR